MLLLKLQILRRIAVCVASVATCVLGVTVAGAVPKVVDCPNDPPRFQSGYYGRCAKVNERGFVAFVAQCFCDGTCAPADDPACVSQSAGVSAFSTAEAQQSAGRRTMYGRVFGMFGRPGRIRVNARGEFDPAGTRTISDRFNYGACRRGRGIGMVPSQRSPAGGICVDLPARRSSRSVEGAGSFSTIPFPSE